MSSAEERVRGLLRDRGVDDRTIDMALESGRIALLALERLTMPDGRRYTPLEVAAVAGVPRELTARLWQALGFPSVPDDDPAFTDEDLEALAALDRLVEQGLADLDVAVLFARVIGSSVARIAETQVGIELGRHETDKDRLAVAETLLSTPVEALNGLAEIIVYAWRRHLQAAVRRGLAADRVDQSGTTYSLAVGFADLVGYTALSQQISDAALGQLVSRFEETAHDVVTSGGGRVVKMIGDEVMFVVDDLEKATQIALNLADVFGDDELLSDVRVGLAHGSVLTVEGDYYGPVVNLASRLVNVAYPGSVVVSEEVHAALVADDRLTWKSLRTRHLKGIGNVALWVVARGGDTGPRRTRSLKTLLSEAGLARMADPKEEKADGASPSATARGRRSPRTVGSDGRAGRRSSRPGPRSGRSRRPPSD